MITNHNNHCYFLKNMTPDGNNRTMNDNKFFSRRPEQFQEKWENNSNYTINLLDRQALNYLCNVYCPNVKNEKC